MLHPECALAPKPKGEGSNLSLTPVPRHEKVERKDAPELVATVYAPTGEEEPQVDYRGHLLLPATNTAAFPNRLGKHPVRERLPRKTTAWWFAAAPVPRAGTPLFSFPQLTRHAGRSRALMFVRPVAKVAIPWPRQVPPTCTRSATRASTERPRFLASPSNPRRSPATPDASSRPYPEGPRLPCRGRPEWPHPHLSEPCSSLYPLNTRGRLASITSPSPRTHSHDPQVIVPTRRAMYVGPPTGRGGYVVTLTRFHGLGLYATNDVSSISPPISPPSEIQACTGRAL